MYVINLLTIDSNNAPNKKIYGLGEKEMHDIDYTQKFLYKNKVFDYVIRYYLRNMSKIDQLFLNQKGVRKRVHWMRQYLSCQ